MLVFIFLAICLSLTSLKNESVDLLLNDFRVENVCFVTAENVESEEVEPVMCGNKYFNYCTVDVAKKLINEIDYDAIQLYLNTESFENLKKTLKYQNVKIEKFNELAVFYGYTPLYQDCVYMDNKKVNMQLVLRDDILIVGFPMILTGY